MVDTSRTSKISPDKIAKIIREHFDMRPKAIIKYLDLSSRSTKGRLAMAISVERNPVYMGEDRSSGRTEEAAGL